MPKSYNSCKYCGHNWIMEVSPYQVSYYQRGVVCPKCSDKKIKFRLVEAMDVYGYNYVPKERLYEEE